MSICIYTKIGISTYNVLTRYIIYIVRDTSNKYNDIFRTKLKLTTWLTIQKDILNEETIHWNYSYE